MTPTVTPAPRATVRFNPFSPEFRRDPYPIYRQLREGRPVHRTMGMWVLTRYADVRSVLHDRTFGAGLIPQLVTRQADLLRQDDVERIKRLGDKSLVFTDDPDHARLRLLVNRVFTARNVAGLRPRVEAIADGLVQRALDDGGMDAIAGLAAPLPLAVMSEWMALPAELRPAVGEWTHSVRFLLEPGLVKADRFAEVCAVVETFVRALGDVVAARRARPGDDLISQLLAAETPDGDRLSHEELVFVCIMCFVAGNETTRCLIGNALLALLSHPAQAELLRRRPELARAAVSEVLRYDSPLQLTKRVATAEREVGGQRIGEGQQVLLCLGAANRDPAMFPRPDELDITRDQRGHLGFGYGMHACLGGTLAELQAAVALDRLYRRAALALATEDLSWQDHSFIVRGVKQLPVVLTAAGR
jgi:cytochrome P450